MKVEDVALQIYCALVARDGPQQGDIEMPSEAMRRSVVRQALRYAAEFLAVCQEQTEGKR